VFGVTFPPSLQDNITTSWEACLKGVKVTIAFWSIRHLTTTLRLKRDALETFVFTKMRHLAGFSPLFL
jgi:hypothetical protein